MKSAMILEYREKALSHARYEIIDDEESYYGEVPGLAGVYANGRSLEECRENLKHVIEGWILVRREQNLAVVSIFRKAGFIEEENNRGLFSPIFLINQ
ncbi:putative RNase H-like HicB family nuclease [Methanocalculus alkaliphilus]|uniref:type II toxin-antitoxin system HicB family antitoxin n=1 Tax=Methanocalculus alkaliphilus TaxID=768730 RepID=UPI00209CF718|nr:type II toxin-antitoxin system HicB family antitoxin [Methanocalculus alkaliphilus]MCP1716343.1 putative RNase H-like HicB family nuclease [Methanocalculus alkaliphilus]